MRKNRIVVLLLLVALLATAGVASARHGGTSFQANLSGAREVPNPVHTSASGQASFEFNADGTELHYRVEVNDLVDTLMAHIHLGPSGENGPVVVWLYPDGPPPVLIPGVFSGVLAEGTITADDLVGPLEGATLADLANAMVTQNTYVNVHTVENPGGEIRGQIR